MAKASKTGLSHSIEPNMKNHLIHKPDGMLREAVLYGNSTFEVEGDLSSLIPTSICHSFCVIPFIGKLPCYLLQIILVPAEDFSNPAFYILLI